MAIWNTPPTPTQAKAYLGVSNLNAIFSFNPDEVKWSYKNNTVSRDTIGGRVVQILSASAENMSVIGRAGSRGRLQEFARDLKKIMQYQIKTGETVNFKVPSRNWDFRVYIQNVSSLGWDVTTTSYPYEITLVIEEDLNNITHFILKKEAFENIMRGIGYNPEYHGGNLAEATRYVEAMRNALGSIEFDTDTQSSSSPKFGRGKFKPREGDGRGNAGLAKKLLSKVDLDTVPQISDEIFISIEEIYALAYWALEQMGDLRGSELKEIAIMATAISCCETQSHDTRAENTEATNGSAFGLWQMNEGLGTSLWDPVVAAIRMAEEYYEQGWLYWQCGPLRDSGYKNHIDEVRSAVG